MIVTVTKNQLKAVQLANKARAKTAPEGHITSGMIFEFGNNQCSIIATDSHRFHLLQVNAETEDDSSEFMLSGYDIQWILDESKKSTIRLYFNDQCTVWFQNPKPEGGAENVYLKASRVRFADVIRRALKKPMVETINPVSAEFMIDAARAVQLATGRKAFAMHIEYRDQSALISTHAQFRFTAMVMSLRVLKPIDNLLLDAWIARQ